MKTHPCWFKIKNLPTQPLSANVVAIGLAGSRDRATAKMYMHIHYLYYYLYLKYALPAGPISTSFSQRLVSQGEGVML